MTSRTTRGSDFTRTRGTRTPRTRDPLGKAALFSDAPSASGPPVSAAAGTEAGAESEGRGATQLFSRTEARPGTLVVDCSGCGRHTRVTYAEFAALHFPLWLWIPAPARTHRHWLRCPACRNFAWLRAGWLQ
jgi:hypothetical protein